MVSCIIKGRLGNNGFIQMAAFAYALKHGLEYHCPKQTLAPHLWPNYFTHLLNPDWNPDLETIYVNDNQHSFRELEFKEEWRDKNIIIGTTDINSGYFQSHLYIKNYEKQLLYKFDLLEYSPKENACSIHFRASDYKLLPKHHPLITKGYLKSAIDTILDKTKCEQFVVYTDDMDYCYPILLELRKEFKNIEILLSIGGSELDDFSSLISYKYNIVSNSSYSVLAAILNPNKEKVVVCPHEDNYFGELNKKLDVSTLYPESWIRIKY